METDCNSSKHLISLPGYTQRGGRKKTHFLFHIIKVSLLYQSLSQGNQPTASTLTAEAKGLHPEASGEATGLRRERPILPTLANSNLHGPRSSSSCPNTSEGSSPVSFDWQPLCRRAWRCVHWVSGLSQTTVCQCTGCGVSEWVSEWVESDVADWREWSERGGGGEGRRREETGLQDLAATRKSSCSSSSSSQCQTQTVSFRRPRLIERFYLGFVE